MLENLLQGWWGKFMVLVLLGFATTDFVITMTLSASDAARHATENPYLHPLLGDANLRVTLILLALLAAVFLKGFAEAIELATAVCVPYLLLNVVVLIRALFEVGSHPLALPRWENALNARGDWTQLALGAVILFPRLALGLSGFETGVSVMPLIRGAETDSAAGRPQGRIRNTRKLLATAALIMSVLLLVSSFVSALLIPEQAYREGGPASGRALAYLAHVYLGNIFGSVYDLSTILVLWFAGASAMAGLLHLVPRYLPRVGLAPEWVAYARPLVLVLFAFDVVVTLSFRANVEAQGGAYATGVLVLMLSAAVAASISLWKEQSRLLSIYCWGVVAGLRLYDGGEHHRAHRRHHHRQLLHPVYLDRKRHQQVLACQGNPRGRPPLCERGVGAALEPAGGPEGEYGADRQSGVRARSARTAMLRKHYKVEGPLVFVHVRLLDNRSEFLSPLEITVREEAGQYLVKASQAVAKANAVAYISELLHPAAIYLGLSRQNLMRQSFRYFLLGEGETGLMVYTILQHLWESTPGRTSARASS